LILLAGLRLLTPVLSWSLASLFNSDSRIIAHHSTELDEVSKQLSREIDELLREFVDEEVSADDVALKM